MFRPGVRVVIKSMNWMGALFPFGLHASSLAGAAGESVHSPTGKSFCLLINTTLDLLSFLRRRLVGVEQSSRVLLSRLSAIGNFWATTPFVKSSSFFLKGYDLGICLESTSTEILLLSKVTAKQCPTVLANLPYVQWYCWCISGMWLHTWLVSASSA